MLACKTVRLFILTREVLKVDVFEVGSVQAMRAPAGIDRDN